MLPASRLARLMTKRRPFRPTRELRLGFVPLIDCAPFAAAEEMGIFSRRGLRVRLEAQPGWATIRDKIARRELDAAHAVCGLPYSAVLGIGCTPSRAVVSLILSLQGNALILSRALWDAGIRDPRSFGLFAAQSGRKPVLAVVSRFSAYHFLLHAWLRRGGLAPGKDVHLPVLPPALMAANLQEGYLDGYCVGEPWGSAAIAGGFGVCAATSADLEPGHPEKVLLLHPGFAEDDPDTHQLLIASLLEACGWCDLPQNRPVLAEILASRRWLDLPKEWLSLSLCGPYPGPPSAVSHTSFVAFARTAANDPTRAREDWIWRHLQTTGAVPSTTARPTGVFRREDYLSVCRQVEKALVPASA